MFLLSQRCHNVVTIKFVVMQLNVTIIFIAGSTTLGGSAVERATPNCTWVGRAIPDGSEDESVTPGGSVVEVTPGGSAVECATPNCPGVGRVLPDGSGDEIVTHGGSAVEMNPGGSAFLTPPSLG